MSLLWKDHAALAHNLIRMQMHWLQLLLSSHTVVTRDHCARAHYCGDPSPANTPRTEEDVQAIQRVCCRGTGARPSSLQNYLKSRLNWFDPITRYE